MPSPERPSSLAELLFSDWLAGQDAPEGSHLERLCRDHPEQADELRALGAQWSRIRSILRRGEPEVNPVASQDAPRAVRSLGGAEERIERE